MATTDRARDRAGRSRTPRTGVEDAEPLYDARFMGSWIRMPVVIVVGAILALAVLSLVLPSTATYDPWAWIVWGREVTHGNLNTIDGPSWKPLPVVFTTVAAPFGEAAPYVWIAVARAGAIAAVVLAFEIGRRTVSPIAGILAAVPLALAPWWIWNGALANSEGLLMALVLGAILAHLEGRHRLALACGIGAGLLRPEVWPFLLLYVAVLAWRRDWRWRAGALAALAILPPAWLLPERWGSGDFWRAASRAQNPDPGAASLTANPSWTVLRNFADMLPNMSWIVLAAAGLAVLLVEIRRRAGRARSGPTVVTAAPEAEAPARSGATSAASPHAYRVALFLLLFGLAWLAVVVVMTERGFSGNQRYLIPPASLLVVAAAIAAGQGLRRVPGWPAGLVLALATLSVAYSATRDVPEQLRRVGYEARMVHNLPDVIAQAGGAARLRACGPISTLNLVVPQVAWAMKMHAVDISDTPDVPGQSMVVLRNHLNAKRPLQPDTANRNDLHVLASSRYWQIEATCPPAAGAAR